MKRVDRIFARYHARQEALERPRKRVPSQSELWQLLRLDHRRETSRWEHLRVPTIALLLLLLLAWLLNLLS